mmetsp:Transcript_25066/g.81052  ORF Transcript_25066/g.81052 Transcript_25066/m.81052 type:complete len:138 (-) Transcript_25066:490-903(-)
MRSPRPQVFRVKKAPIVFCPFLSGSGAFTFFAGGGCSYLLAGASGTSFWGSLARMGDVASSLAGGQFSKSPTGRPTSARNRSAHSSLKYSLTNRHDERRDACAASPSAPAALGPSSNSNCDSAARAHGARLDAQEGF